MSYEDTPLSKGARQGSLSGNIPTFEIASIEKNYLYMIYKINRIKHNKDM